MSNTIFIIGGARSGKSDYALELGSKIPGRKGFIATAEAYDEEMKERIKLHRKVRPSEWETIEEPLYINKRLQDVATLYDVVIVDCLTLWLSNMLSHGFTKDDENPPSPVVLPSGEVPKIPSPLTGEGQGGGELSVSADERIKSEITALTSVLQGIKCKVILVSNEVGLGIVPENKIARLFRDLGGWMNQQVAAAVGEVYLVTCGIPVKIK